MLVKSSFYFEWLVLDCVHIIKATYHILLLVSFWEGCGGEGGREVLLVMWDRKRFRDWNKKIVSIIKRNVFFFFEHDFQQARLHHFFEVCFMQEKDVG